MPYRFETPHIGIKVCLHDESGKQLEVAQFGGGHWETDNEALGEAMLRAISGTPEYEFQVVEATPPEQPEQPALEGVDEADAPDEAASAEGKRPTSKGKVNTDA